MSLTVLSPLVGLRLDGSSITPWNDHERVPGAVGQPIWGPRGLLDDLELRVGVLREEVAPTLRAQQWAARLDACAARGRFYSRSHAVDRFATAAAVLDWRDVLVDAGWQGDVVRSGGPRLDALAELNAIPDAMPPGPSDRLARIEREIRQTGDSPYHELTLAEPASLWPGRWRTVFELLRRGGMKLTVLEADSVRRAPEQSLLGRLQASLLNGAPPATLAHDDDSLILLRAPTSWELGEALGAMLRLDGSPSIAFVRGGELTALDAGLVRQGFRALGSGASSPHRPLLQVLPLAIELAFEPRDPHRVLELLTLPVGPFRGLVGWWLARAVVEAPGIGGPVWQDAKERLAAELIARSEDARTVERRRARIADWLEQPGTPRGQRAGREELVAVARRVEDWLRANLVRDEGDEVLVTAFGQARELRVALAADGREALSLVEVRMLADRITAAGAWARLVEERAGRFDHVGDPGALLTTRDTVVFWHAVAGTQKHPEPPPFDAAELAALEAAGVRFPDPDARLADEASAWRRVALAARRRLIIAVPDVAAGRPTAPHPFWDEIVARLDLDDAAIDGATTTAWRLRAGCVPTTELRGLDLPEASATWRVEPGAIPRAARHSASSLEALLACPLRWVLGSALGLRSGAAAALAHDHVIAGQLGHRLVQRLHEGGDLTGDHDHVERRARALLATLIVEEGAPWLLPGRSFDREQWSELLIRSVLELARRLAASGLRPVAVEKEVTLAWEGRELVGRIDLLVEDDSGRPVVIDLKWGAATYRKRLIAGSALQLAVYSRAAGVDSAAYYALNAARFLTVEPGLVDGAEVVVGPSLADTWDRACRTAAAVEVTLDRGEVPVTGVRRSPGLMDALAVAEPERLSHFVKSSDPCAHCALDPICGRRWERIT